MNDEYIAENTENAENNRKIVTLPIGSYIGWVSMLKRNSGALTMDNIRRALLHSAHEDDVLELYAAREELEMKKHKKPKKNI